MKTQGKALRNMLTVDGQNVFKNDGNQTHALVVNGEMLGSSSNSGSPDTFGVSYVAVNAQSLTAPPSSYTVHAGDTLQSIAKAVWGDGSLWYLIAEANGLSGNATVGEGLTEGQAITIPSRSNTVHNDFSTSKPYDPSSIVGDTTPNLPMPANDGCGGMGQVITIIVAIVATVFTAGAAALAAGAVTGTTSAFAAGATLLSGGAIGVGGAALAAGSFGAAAFGSAVLGGAIGSIVSQGVGIAIGVQDSFSWNGVALGAVSAGVTAGVGAAFAGTSSIFAGTNPLAFAGRAAISSAITQGVGVATGLQDKFNWGNVAASAVGAGVGAAVSQGLVDILYGAEIAGPMRPGEILGRTGGLASSIGENAARVAGDTISGFAGGMVTTAMKGGRISVTQIAADAFGNALGNSIAEMNWGGSQQESELTRFRRMEIEAMNASAREEASMGLGSGLNPYRSSAPGLRVSERDYADWSARIDEGIRHEAKFVRTPSQEEWAESSVAAAGASIGSLRSSGRELSYSETMDVRDIRLSFGYQSTLSMASARAAKIEATKRQDANGPSFVAWDGVSRDPYASGRRNLEMALAGTTVAAAVVIPATAASMTAAGAVYSAVGPWGTAGIGFVTAGGMDAGMQYYDSGTVRPVQSMFSGAVGAISGPVGATSGLWTNIVLGGTGAAVNTGFQNLYYRDDKSLVVPTLVGSAFGAGGYYAGMATTKGLSYFKPEIYYPNLNPQMPALFQPRAINIVPGAVGVSVGGIASGTAPMGESLINSLSPPSPKR